MRRTLFIGWACCVFGFGASCDPLAQQPEATDTGTPIGAEVVATVGSETIEAADVRARMKLSGVDARTALDALVEEELLLQAARKAGVDSNPDAERRVDRTMVRRFLRDLEDENDPEDIPAELVREDFHENQEVFQTPERRDSWHILIKEDSDEAEALASRLVEELRRATDPKTVFERYRDPGALGIELPISVEDLPPMTRKAGIEKAYKDAIFEAKTIGPLKSPVKTGYGWHAVVLTEIEPGRSRALRDVEDEIRERLSQERRFTRLAEIVRRLESEGLVTRQEMMIERLIAAEKVPQRAE